MIRAKEEGERLTGAAEHGAWSNADITNQSSRAMMEHVQRRSVGLVIDDDHRPGGIGSGTCVQIGDRHFIATAAHVVAGVDLSRFAIVSLGLRAFTRNTPKLAGHGWRGGGDNDPRDVGWLEIVPGAVPDFVGIYQRIFVTLERFDFSPVPVGSPAYVLGTPWDYRKEVGTARDPIHLFEPLPYLTRVVEPPDGAAPEGELFLEYPREMLTERGTKPLPKAPGLSGSGFWTVNASATNLWSPDHAKLVGIEHSWCQWEYLRGGGLREWLVMIREDVPELSPHIDPVLFPRRA